MEPTASQALFAMGVGTRRKEAANVPARIPSHRLEPLGIRGQTVICVSLFARLFSIIH